MKLSKMKQCNASQFTHKIEQNGALQFKNNGEKVPASLHQAYTVIQKSHSPAPFKANTDVP